MNIFVSEHPLVKSKIGQLRSDDLATKDFRKLVKELGALLCYELSANFTLIKENVSTWQGNLSIEVVDENKLTVVPILRAGMGMLDGVLEFLGNTSVSVVGIYRDEETLQPVSYFEKLDKNISKQSAIIIDPMLATGGSLDATINLLKKNGCEDISALVLVAAPEGVGLINKNHPDVKIYTAALDEKLNENGYILPGLGDAGDKIFGTIN